MLKIRLLFVLCLTIGVRLAIAQNTANGWIDYSKDYYKIKIAKTGIFRVTAAELTSAGVPVSNIAIGRYQLFRRGKEVAINARDDNGDGRMDYFEFYGQKNDGTGDTQLYTNPNAQPHTYYNLFTDTASYFLTWNLTALSGKRMAFSSIKDASGLTPQSYHIDQQLQLQTNTYSSGIRYGSGFDIQSAVYDYGEGWTGSEITKNNSRNYEFSLQNHNVTGPSPVVEVLLGGVSNFDHLTEISVGPSTGSLRVIGQADFDGRYNFRFSEPMNWSDVGPNGELVVQVKSVGYAGQTDAINVAYVRVDYAQSPTMIGTEKHYYLPDLSESRGYVRIPTTNASAITVYDVTDSENVVRVATSAYSDRLEFVYQDTTKSGRKFFVRSTANQVAGIAQVQMVNYPLATSNYVLLYHPTLNLTTNGLNPVDEYVAYRSSTTGGGFKVLDMPIQDVYDQYNYGDPSPLAIKSLMAHASSVGSPEYLFLVGKGTTVNLGYHRKTSAELTHYIPTYGFPGADILFSVFSESNLTHQVPTGRVNAFNSADVLAYLNKVKEMEAVPYNALWRKNLVQLSGGQTPAELRIFKNYIQNFKSIAEGDFMGGQAFNINKNNTDVVARINVAEEVNSGTSMITFFGHSSGFVTDVEIGRASDPSDGYSNKGKYPTFLVNGCNAGEIFANTFTFGEDWIRTPDAGAIAFVANSDFALSSNLKRYSDLFYQFTFANEATFGESIGNIIQSVSDRYFQIYGTDGLSRSQVYQTLLQGDPAVTVFGAKSPDYEIRSSETFATAFENDRVLSNLDSFQINLVVRNYGRSVNDSLEVEIQRTFSHGGQAKYRQRFERVLRHDTLRFTIDNSSSFTSEGTNSFVIRLDPDEAVTELNEANNTANFTLFIPKGNTIPIYPIEFGTVAGQTTQLVWQSANQLEQTRTYSLQIDTTVFYSSPFAKKQEVSGGLVMRYDLDLLGLSDSSTIYWRTRFADPQTNEDTNWVESSFSLIPDLSNGWSQVDGWQLAADSYEGLVLDPESKTLDFVSTSSSIQINTHGVDSELAYEDYQVIVDGINLLLTDAPADPDCKRKNAINAVAFSKISAQPYRPFGISGIDVNNDLVCGRVPQMIHNFNENDVLGSSRYLDSLIKVMETGDMLLLFTFDSMAFSNWDAQLLSSLSQVGIRSATVSGLTDGQPVIFLGRKGDAEGSAIEVTSNGSSIPRKEQAIDLIDEVTGKYNSGIIRSTRIGPSKRWSSFHYDVQAQSNDFWQFSVVGIDSNGSESAFFTGSRQSFESNEIDLSSLPASNYPYLRVEFFVADDQSLTPPALKSWGVEYDLPPEGVLIPESIATQTVQEGEPVTAQYRYVNISEVSYQDSLSVEASFTNISTGDRLTQQFNIGAPVPGDTTEFELTTATRGRVGENNISVVVTPGETELLPVNNFVSRPGAFTVYEDDVNPVLDVTFDGGYILDGDIVSPSPNILIRIKDNNEYLYKDDTTGINLEIKRSCEACIYERVSLLGSDVTYTTASEGQDFEINYTPGPLEDGIYHLKVQGTDESGNKSGVTPYEVSFEVINESSVTHFYPYPNPFSTSTRFVFTLTGSSMPDEIKIQIMTVSGRVVREITQDEIGLLRIGNNITEYAWDGRDEFGDQLANGVYLYRVFIRQRGEQIKHRITTADRAFKNGFGKIYLLR